MIAATAECLRSEFAEAEQTTEDTLAWLLQRGTSAATPARARPGLEERMLIGPDFDDRGLVFHKPDGSWLLPDGVEQFLHRVRRYRLTFHGLATPGRRLRSSIGSTRR